jgi:hypothetical protein
VAIVNETLARRAWRGEGAVGKRILVGASRRPVDVIGVVRDAKYRTIGESTDAVLLRAGCAALRADLVDSGALDRSEPDTAGPGGDP